MDNDSRQRSSGHTGLPIDNLKGIVSIVNKVKPLLGLGSIVWIVIGGVAVFTFIQGIGAGEAAGLPSDQAGQQSTPITSNPTAKCSAGVGLCSPENLSIFGNSSTAASVVCAGESAGNSIAVNDHCLLPYSDPLGSLDYSVGLFQINLLAQCADAFSWIDPDPGNKIAPPGHSARCEISNPERLNSCKAKLLDKDANIRLALDIFNTRGGLFSKDWGAALACGIL